MNLINQTPNPPQDIFLEAQKLPFEDSLFYSKLYHRLFKSRKKYLSIIEEISSSLHDYQARCFENVREIVDSIPEEWGYNSGEIFESLKQGIFSEEWLASVKRTFNEFTSQMTQRL